MWKKENLIIERLMMSSRRMNDYRCSLLKMF